MARTSGVECRRRRRPDARRRGIRGRLPLGIVALLSAGLLLGIPAAVDSYFRNEAFDAAHMPSPAAREVENRTSGPTETVAFVGQILALVEVRREENRLAFYREFRVRYRILEAVYGSLDAGEIDLEYFMHEDGIPYFVEIPTFLVYANRYGERWVQERGSLVPLHPTVSGRLAGCGDPFHRFAVGVGRPIWPGSVEFAPPVVFDLNDDSYAVIEKEYGRGSVRRIGDRAICVTGASPAEIVLAGRHAHLAHGLRIE